MQQKQIKIKIKLKKIICNEVQQSSDISCNKYFCCLKKKSILSDRAVATPDYFSFHLHIISLSKPSLSDCVCVFSVVGGIRMGHVFLSILPLYSDMFLTILTMRFHKIQSHSLANVFLQLSLLSLFLMVYLFPTLLHLKFQVYIL